MRNLTGRGNYWKAAGKTVLRPDSLLVSLVASSVGCALTFSPKYLLVLGVFAGILVLRWLLTTLGFWVADTVNSSHSGKDGR